MAKALLAEAPRSIENDLIVPPEPLEEHAGGVGVAAHTGDLADGALAIDRVKELLLPRLAAPPALIKATRRSSGRVAPLYVGKDRRYESLEITRPIRTTLRRKT
jgi:hypothetical protein